MSSPSLPISLYLGRLVPCMVVSQVEVAACKVSTRTCRLPGSHSRSLPPKACPCPLRHMLTALCSGLCHTVVITEFGSSSNAASSGDQDTPWLLDFAKYMLNFNGDTALQATYPHSTLVSWLWWSWNAVSDEGEPGGNSLEGRQDRLAWPYLCEHDGIGGPAMLGRAGRGGRRLDWQD